MFAPAAAGSGTSVLEMARSGLEATVVVASGPVCGRISLLSIVQPVLVITVPFASGLFTLTTSCTDPDTPAFTAPRFQVTTPADCVPPPVADTQLVLAGRGSRRTTPVALLVPVFWYASVYVMLLPA